MRPWLKYNTVWNFRFLKGRFSMINDCLLQNVNFTKLFPTWRCHSFQTLEWNAALSGTKDFKL